MLKDTGQRELGRKYIDFLTSEAGQKAIAANGILPAETIQ